MSVFFAQKGKGRRGIDHEKKRNIDMNGWIIMDGWMDGKIIQQKRYIQHSF